MDIYEEKRLHWINFLERFVANQLDIKFSDIDSRYVNFKIENILDTEISIDSKYGFLTINFPSAKIERDFVNHSGYCFTQNDQDSVSKEQYKSFTNKFPCRIYNNSLSLNFYDPENKHQKEDLLNRILVFENILQTILKLKVANIKATIF